MDCDEFTVLPSCCVYVAFFSFFSPSPLDPIRLTLRLNVGTWETLPSVTLQMALRVKVGHGETLSSTRRGTMEITGV